ncbi:zinc finger protein 718 isoform X2 [Anabrus simplex]|uniref:zinc finger protein 718 isoform X2 n=1 Tax=Anabrus simplex TaxID=316456 RepID=UPI0034DD8880
MSSAVFSGDVCRLCLWKTNALLAIFGLQGDKQGVAKKIRTLLPFRISSDDPLPKGVCPNCVYKLEMFYEFYNACITSNEKLRKYLLGPMHPPIVYLHDEPEEDMLKPEALEDPIAISCEDIQQCLNYSDLGHVSYEHSAQTTEPDNSAVFQDDQVLNGILEKESSTSFPYMQNVHNASEKENDISTFCSEQTSHTISVKTTYSSIRDRCGQTSLSTTADEGSARVIQDIQTSHDVSAKESNASTVVDENSSNGLIHGARSDSDATVTSSSARGESDTAKNRPRVVTPVEDGFPCSRCSQKFKTRALLNLHFCSTPRTKFVNCRFCDRKFKTMHHLALHKKVHITRASFSCKECGKKFKSAKAIKSHRISDCHTVKAVSLDHMYSTSYGPFSRPAFRCSLCDRVCATAAVYGRHLKSKEHRHNVYKIRQIPYKRNRKIPENNSEYLTVMDKAVHAGEDFPPKIDVGHVAIMSKKFNIRRKIPVNVDHSSTHHNEKDNY